MENLQLTKDVFKIVKAYDSTGKEIGDYMIIGDYNPHQVVDKILMQDQQLKWILDYLRKELTEQQKKELSVVMDPEARKILAYLASDRSKSE